MAYGVHYVDDQDGAGRLGVGLGRELLGEWWVVGGMVEWTGKSYFHVSASDSTQTQSISSEKKNAILEHLMEVDLSNPTEPLYQN